jgi:hypothetical protein
MDIGESQPKIWKIFLLKLKKGPFSSIMGISTFSLID